MRTRLINLLFSTSLLLSTLIFASFSSAEQQHEKEHKESAHTERDEHEGHDEDEETVLNLSDKQIQELGIVLEKANPGRIAVKVSVPGETVVNEETLSHISARFPGIVKEVKKRIGDHVKAGDSLASIESNESLSLYTIKSLIDGVVIDKHATLGELLREEDIAFSIANLDSVWIHLSIYQMDLASVEKGQKVSISQGHGQITAEGHISYVSPVLDEATRTAVARVIISNSNGSWPPGLFVTAKITVKEEQVSIRIPLTAVHTIENTPTVFIKTQEVIHPQPVVLGISNDTFVEIKSGLSEGQEYAAKNGFILKAELQKGSFGDAHNH